MRPDRRDARVAELLAENQKLQGGCCASPDWRGILCDYHEGFADGLAEILFGEPHPAEDG